MTILFYILKKKKILPSYNYIFFIIFRLLTTYNGFPITTARSKYLCYFGSSPKKRPNLHFKVLHPPHLGLRAHYHQA